MSRSRLLLPLALGLVLSCTKNEPAPTPPASRPTASNTQNTSERAPPTAIITATSCRLRRTSSSRLAMSEDAATTTISPSTSESVARICSRPMSMGELVSRQVLTR